MDYHMGNPSSVHSREVGKAERKYLRFLLFQRCRSQWQQELLLPHPPTIKVGYQYVDRWIGGLIYVGFICGGR